MRKILHRLVKKQGRQTDPDELLRIASQISGGKTVCAFGEACSWPVESFVTKFKEEFINKSNQNNP
jgi:NADH-quinone oxidoreductase subunit F